MDLFKLVGSFIAAIVTLMLIGTIIFGIFLFKGCNAIQKDGLKGVAEKVWNGTNGVPAPEGLK